MSTTLTVTAVTATTATVTFTNLPAGGKVEIQVADNPDFRGLAPFRAYTATPAVLVGLNQRGTFYIRGRTVTAGGVRAVWGATSGFRSADGTAWNTAPAGNMLAPAIIVPPEPFLSLQYNYGSLAGYPPNNMFRDDPQLVWQAGPPGADGVIFAVETTGAPMDTFALLDTTAAETTAFTVYYGATLAEAIAQAPARRVGPFTRASANLPQRAGYHFMGRAPAPIAAKFWAFVLDYTNAGMLNQIMARYLVIGLARTAKSIAADKMESPLDLGSIDRTRAGGPDRVWGHKMRKVDFELALLTEMQWETQFADLWRKIALNEPVLVVPNSKAGAFLHDRILYGTVAQSRSTQVVSPLFTYGLSVESLI